MLRVLTLNLWNISGDWRARREEILVWLRQLDADVVCLQEILADADGRRNTARWLAERTGYRGVATGAIEARRTGVLLGNAILSRQPIDREATHLLPTAPREGDIQRVLLHASTGGIDVFCTHLTSLYECSEQRERQVLRIDELVAEHADPASRLPPILAGDFNAEPDSTEIRFLTGSTSLHGRSTYFQDAWRVAGGRGTSGSGSPEVPAPAPASVSGTSGSGSTWSNENPFAAAEFEPDRRIDYIFSGWRRDDGRGRIVACSVVCDRPLTGVYASDHFGVLADIAS